MALDYQIVVDVVCTMFLLAIPISLCFGIGIKLVSIFTSFVNGGRVNL